MNDSIEKSTDSGVNILEKIKSLSKSSSFAPEVESKLSSISDKDNVYKQAFSFKFVFSVIRYMIAIYLGIFIIVLILDKLNLLPKSLGELFNKFSLFKIKLNKPVKKVQIKEDDIVTAIEKPSSKKSNNLTQPISPINNTPLSKPLPNPLPKPDKTTSAIQTAKSNNKSGYCLVGEDRGFRSCIHVKNASQCMSGDIFPTQAVCVNPKLRP